MSSNWCFSPTPSMSLQEAVRIFIDNGYVNDCTGLMTTGPMYRSYDANKYKEAVEIIKQALKDGRLTIAY